MRERHISRRRRLRLKSPPTRPLGGLGLTNLVVEYAKRENPDLTDAQAFAKVFSAPTEDGIMLRKAYNAVKAAAFDSETKPDVAFAILVRDRADALFVAGDMFFVSRRVQFATLAARYGIPAAYSTRELVEAGGLMSYGTDLLDNYRQPGVYTGQILLSASRAAAEPQSPLVDHAVAAAALLARDAQYRHGEWTKTAIAEGQKFSALLKILHAGLT